MPGLWYFQRDGVRHGPFRAADLKQRADAGDFGPADLIWKEGLERWIPARSLKGLFPAIAPNPAEALPPPLPEACAGAKRTGPPPLPDEPPTPPPLPTEQNHFGVARRPTQPSRSKGYGLRKPGFVGILAVVSAGSFLLLCLVPLAVWAVLAAGHSRRGADLTEQVAARTPDRITAEYLPYKIGAIAEYEIEMPGFGSSRQRFRYETGGRRLHTLVSVGGQFLNQQQSPHQQVEQDGCVGLLWEDGTWFDCLKVGARVGDTWKQNRGKSVYTVKEFGKYRLKYDGSERPAVTISEETNQDVGGAKVTDSIYVLGVGLVSKNSRSRAGPMRWTLREFDRSANLTAAERKFFE